MRNNSEQAILKLAMELDEEQQKHKKLAKQFETEKHQRTKCHDEKTGLEMAKGNWKVGMDGRKREFDWANFLSLVNQYFLFLFAITLGLIRTILHQIPFHCFFSDCHICAHWWCCHSHIGYFRCTSAAAVHWPLQSAYHSPHMITNNKKC